MAAEERYRYAAAARRRYDAGGQAIISALPATASPKDALPPRFMPIPARDFTAPAISMRLDGAILMTTPLARQLMMRGQTSILLLLSATAEAP